MREYKFRAWNKNTKKMYKIGQITLEKGSWNYEPDNREYIGMSIPYQPSFILMQYTGLKDKNGKEIYEGDIVKVKLYKGEEEKYFIGKVEYFGSNFIVDADNNSEYHVYDLDGFGIDYRYNLEDCEVIGNIYDNPELLEEGE